MKKFFFRFLLLIVASTTISSLSDWEVPIEVLSTFYTVAGIMFSIGLGVIAGFDLRDIKNKEYLCIIRNIIGEARENFILFFALATLGQLLYQSVKDKKFALDFSIQFNCGVFITLIVLFTIFYFVVNFIQLQKLRNQIIDKILEES